VCCGLARPLPRLSPQNKILSLGLTDEAGKRPWVDELPPGRPGVYWHQSRHGRGCARSKALPSSLLLAVYGLALSTLLTYAFGGRSSHGLVASFHCQNWPPL